jgi:hypothetical protein
MTPYAINREVITVNQARDILIDANRGNRRIRRQDVAKFAADMRKGKWYSQLVTNCLIFSQEGRLIDGQHKLTAFVESGLPQLGFLVQRDVPDVVQIAINGSRPNDIKDFSDHEGFDKKTVPVGRSMFNGLTGGSKASNLTRREEIAYLLKHKRALDFSVALFKDVPKRLQRLKVSAVMAVFARATYHYSFEELAMCARVLISGQPINPSHSILIILREALLSVQGGGAGQQQLVYAKTSRALKAALDGETLAVLRATTAELFPILDDHKEM